MRPAERVDRHSRGLSFWRQADISILTMYIHSNNISLKPIIWDEEKNRILGRERGISFEAIVQALEAEGPLWITIPPRPGIYPGQRRMAVLINNYVYIVPFLETIDAVILKTIFPSRKATKRYRKR